VLGLAAVDLAAPGGSMTLTRDQAPGRLQAAIVGGSQGGSEGVGLALARRVLEAAGGHLEVAPGADCITLTAVLPENPAVCRSA
jgi:hypothetical protein